MFRVIIFGLLATLSGAATGPGALSLNLITRSSSVKVGQRVIARVIITNNSDHDITYRDTIPDCDFTFSVFTSAGVSAQETPFKRQMQCEGGILKVDGRVIVVTLKPGESESNNNDGIDISELFDMSAPGEYSLQVSRSFPSVGQFSSNVTKITVTP
jgi:hypothetical protein